MSNEQPQNQVNFGDPATEPVDLAQAFKIYNAANAMPAEQPVEAGGPDEPVAQGGDGEPGSGEPQAPEGTGEGVEAAAPTADEDGDLGSGGSTDVIEPIDFNARRQEILRDIQTQAIQQVRQDFSNNNITPCTIEELYQRDEQTGKVTFKNPDDPTRDFASRAEAQQWVDAFNKQIEMRFRQEVNKKQQELVEASAPQLRLIAFIPKFEAMDKVAQDILDDLIEPYAVKDNGGNIVGYNVNLDAMAAQAIKIAKRIPSQPAGNESENPQEPEQQAIRPAVNLPTGNGSSADEKEPKSIGEALAMYDKQQREKGKK